MIFFPKRMGVFCPVFFVLFSVFFFPEFQSDVYGYHYTDSETGADYVLTGVGIFRQNITDEDGNELSFSESEDGWPSGYSNRTYLSLHGEGMLNSDWEFELDARYDEEEDDEPLNVYLKLINGDNYIIAGDHKEGSFLDTTFTASDDKIRGITLHGEAGVATGTVIAGVVRGESALDLIRGDGTSGRYRLSEAPVIRGSETVKIEIRDKNNSDRIIASTTQLRGRDYTIDYDRGEILFTRTVDESDFRGNPLFIVVNYQYDTPGGTFKRTRYGARTTVQASPELVLGTTFLADSGWDDEFSSDIYDERRQIVGADMTYNRNDRHILYTEFAQSETPSLDPGDKDNAFRADLKTTIVDDLVVRANYWRVGKDFLTFGSRDLGSGNVKIDAENESAFFFKSKALDFDLDPDNSTSLGTDAESYGVSASYEVGYHTLSTGFRRSRNNIPEDDDLPTDQRDSYFASVSRHHPEATNYIVGTEIFVDSGDGVGAVNDSTTTRLVGGVQRTFDGVRLAGPLRAQAAYQFEQFEDDDQDDNSTQTHDFLMRLEMLAVSELLVYVEGGGNYLYEELEDDYTQRSYMGLWGFEGKVNRYFELDGSMKYQEDEDLVLNERSSAEQIYALRWISRPLDVLKTSLHGEYRLKEDFAADRDTTKTLLGGAFCWDITEDLLFHASYEREFDRTEGASVADETSVYDDILVRLDWQVTEDLSLFAHYRVEYDELETEPLENSRVKTTTELFGSKYQITENLAFVSAYRRKVLDDDVENYKMKFYGEFVYSINQYLSVAPGYEYYDYTDTEDEDEEYEASVVYINLIGKL